MPHATPVPCTCHTFRPPPYIWVSSLRRTRRRAPYRWVSRLTLDPSRFRSGVSGRKLLRRVSAQILNFAHPGSQNVYEHIEQTTPGPSPSPPKLLIIFARNTLIFITTSLESTSSLTLFLQSWFPRIATRQTYSQRHFLARPSLIIVLVYHSCQVERVCWTLAVSFLLLSTFPLRFSFQFRRTTYSSHYLTFIPQSLFPTLRYVFSHRACCIELILYCYSVFSAVCVEVFKPPRFAHRHAT